MMFDFSFVVFFILMFFSSSEITAIHNFLMNQLSDYKSILELHFHGALILFGSN